MKIPWNCSVVGLILILDGIDLYPIGSGTFFAGLLKGSWKSAWIAYIGRKVQDWPGQSRYFLGRLLNWILKVEDKTVKCVGVILSINVQIVTILHINITHSYVQNSLKMWSIKRRRIASAFYLWRREVRIWSHSRERGSQSSTLSGKICFKSRKRAILRQIIIFDVMHGL